MHPSDRRPPAPEDVSPRSVAESVGRRLKDELPPPEKPFGEEIVHEVHHALRSHVEGPCELGIYREDEDRSLPGRLGGTPRPIAFDGPWWDWFRRLTPELRNNVLWVAEELNDKDRREALVDVLEERIRKKALSKFLAHVRKAIVWGLITGATIIAWLTDQVSHFAEKWPSVKSFWVVIFGGKS